MSTMLQVAIGGILKFVWTKIQKAIAKAILKVLLPGYVGASCKKCGGAEETNKQSTIEVSVKVDGRTVKVTIDGDQKEESPDVKSLDHQCRVPTCAKRLFKLIRDAAEA